MESHFSRRTAGEHVEVLRNNGALQKRSTFFTGLLFFSVDLLFACQLPGTEAAGVTTHLANSVLPVRCWELGNSEMVIMEHQVRLFSLFLLDTERNYIYWHPTLHVFRRLRVHLLCQYLQINLSQRSNILLSNRHNKSTVLPQLLPNVLSERLFKKTGS